MEVEQFSISRDENSDLFLRFQGRACKNYQGEFHQRKINAKDLKVYADDTLGERRALSFTFHSYHKKVHFTDGQLETTQLLDTHLYQPVGVNTLRNIVRNFCTEAGFEGQYTSHSDKVTCATELFKNNVDEQLIMQQTGHRSTDAVRAYKRPTVEHTKAVSAYLQPPPPKKKAAETPQPLVHQEQANILTQAKSASSASPFKIVSSGNSIQNVYVTINSHQRSCARINQNHH